MDINTLKQMNYEEVRHLYMPFLQSQGIGPNTIKTAYVDSFYLWRKGDHDLFWQAVEGSDADAKAMLLDVLRKNTSGDPEKLVNGYLSHIRRFRLFLASDGTAEIKKEQSTTPPLDSARVKYRRKSDIDIPTPSKEQVESYLAKWDTLENYHLQEDALDKLFHKLCPKNTDITDILLKVSTLNDFYSTNIFSVYPVAKHILSLGIDARLKAGDVTLVNDIKQITIGGIDKNFYSFASKYCSHHNPLDYPIYDSYVDVILRYFRNRDAFSSFADSDLKDYVRFKGALIDFRMFYGLQEYNLKLIDRYIWLLGKEYFPKNYGKKG